VNKYLILTALSTLIAAPSIAQPQDSLDEIRKDLAALAERVNRLELDNVQLKTENSALQAENERLANSTEHLKGDASAEVDRASETTERTSRISWKADMRYRHESVDLEEAASEQTRHRIRARLSMTAMINDTLTGTLGLATNGGSNDPRSTMQTIGDAWTRKGIALDLAYVDWHPIDSLTMSFGKMPQPWFKATGNFFDGDLNPEGIALRYAGGPFFANAFGMYLSERSSASDATLLGGQVGVTRQLAGVKLTGALGYFDVGSVQGEVTTTSTLPCTANPAFFGGPQGNTTVLDGTGCPILRYDFNMIEAIAQAEFSFANQPVQLFAQYIRNQEASDLDTGWVAGFHFGQASEPNTWEIGYFYGVTEKDAQFGQFVDSDFGNGVTDAEGSVFKLGYAPARNWIINGAYYLNDRFIDAPTATERSYDRFQFDLNYKF
jgi:Putative porin